MRVLMVTQAYYPFLERGGPAVKVRSIAERLAQRGHDVTVLTADYGFRNGGSAKEHGKFENELSGEPQGRETHECFHPAKSPWGWEAELAGVEVVYVPTLLRYRAVTLNFRVVRFCLRRLREFDLAHIYGTYDLLGPAVGFFCRRRGLPHVVEPMGMYRPIVRSLRAKRFYRSVFGQSLVQGARFLIATSEQEQQELAEEGVPESKVIVRRNGVEVPARFPERGKFRGTWGIVPEAKVVLFLGRLVSKKSPDLLLEAFARCAALGGQAERAVLVLAGPDEKDGYLERLRERAGKLGLNGRVLFTGPLYGEAKWSAYRDADVFVLPSQHENFGNTVAEAVACGTPVIVTDRCGISSLVAGRAGLVLPHDRAALARGLTSLLWDDALRERLRAGCAQVIRDLSWEEPIALMETLYAKLVSEAGLH
jgi:glycosyltransferase involved in cell wall biosynthesis